MLLQIHDELVFEAPDEELAAPRRDGPSRDDRGAGPESPLKVNLAAGPNWLDVEPLPDNPAG